MFKSTCSVGRSIKMCLSSLPGLMRALSKISALLVEARTMTWSVVPIPAKEEGFRYSVWKSPPLMTTNCSKSQVLLTVHLYQQLVEGLLLFGIGEAWHVGGALLSHSVNLVDVDDAGCPASSLLEQTPDPRSAQACTQTQFKSHQNWGVSALFWY